MSWDPELEELRRREELARRMGGEEKIARQRAAGRLTVRERIEMLLDGGSFHEIGTLAGSADYDGDALVGFTPTNFVIGTGTIDGRKVVVSADDFTVRGGAADASIHRKQVYAEQLANELRLPLIRLLEGTGGGGSVKSLETMGWTYVPMNPGWDYVVANMSAVPVVSAVLGPVAGLGAARAVMSHFSVMVEGTSQLFVAGPPVVRSGMGQDVTKEELGGSTIHGRNGAVDNVARSEEDALAAIRRFVSFVPSSAWEAPPVSPGGDDPARREEGLRDIVPRDRRQPYDMRSILHAVCDRDSLFEIGGGWGRSTITALARLDGVAIAVIANDPKVYAGGTTAAAAEKMRRHIDLAETFHLPVVNFVDQPGFVIGVDAERQATIRAGARAMMAAYEATVPWCSVIVRKVYGVAGAAHGNAHRLNLRYAWPSGDWGSLPLEGGVEAAFKSLLEASDDPETLRKEIQKKLDAVRSPFRTAEHFGIEEIIDPRDTRPLLCEFARIARELVGRDPRPPACAPRP
ncbi:MAG: methylmalonyl-CoA carboxyltransferase [Actinobacteria bacterium]|nr:methylmalonyl-CoA carboxyltransferase [Actinomycetota bacterium]